MNLLSWNCQGLGAALTVHNLKEECLRIKPQLVFLMETKQKSRRVRKVRRKCCFSEEWIVEPNGKSGGLALWWSEELTVNILFSSKNIIHTSLSATNFDTPFYVTFIYGPPDEHDRNLCWNEIRRIARGINNSWLCLGDFNDIILQDEKMGGNPRAMRKILNFQCFVADCELMDLGYNGYRFTWCNNREGENIIRERIDRAFGNIHLREMFPHMQVFNVDPSGSDHHLLHVNCCYKGVKKARSFRFEPMWVKHSDYLSTIKRGWNYNDVFADSKITSFLTRLSQCKEALWRWSKKEFPNYRRRLEFLKSQLVELMQSDRTSDISKMIVDIKTEIEATIDKEEQYWWQRSRIEWLKAGDKNSRFFHLSTINRRHQNSILRLRDDEENWLT